MGLWNWGKEEAKKVVGTEQIKENAGLIKKISAIVFKKKFDTRTETFEEVVARRNLTDEDLRGLYKNHKFTFYLTLLFLLASFVLCIVFLASGSYFGSTTALAACSIFLSQLFRSSFRAYQIKHRKMATPKEWWDNGNDWFPTHFS